MKKLALVLISVFTIFGGLLLTACDKNVSLSVDQQSVVITTNDKNNAEQSYLQKTINVTLKNSDDGVYVEVVNGEDIIYLDGRYATKKSKEQYSFTIHASRSGQAQVKVTSVEDRKQSALIDVTVNTVIESIDEVTLDSVNNHSNKFAIREQRDFAKGREIVFGDYFNFSPITANINDVDWAFYDNEDVSNKTLGDPENPMAEIKDGKLFVYENYVQNTIRLKAYFVENTSISDWVEFDILEEATISKFTLTDFGGEKVVIGENAAEDLSFSLKRNDADLSNLRGYLTLNSKHPVDLELVVMQDTGAGKIELSEKEYGRYFGFNLTDVREPNENEGTYSYGFRIDALDTENNLASGEFFFYLRIQYRDYAFSVDTSEKLARVDVGFTVESVQVQNDNGDTLNEGKVDVYSSYVDSFGYALHVLLRPETVTVNEKFRILINLNQSAFGSLRIADEQGRQQTVNENNISKVLEFRDSRGREIGFSRAGASENICSDYLSNNEVLYLLAGDAIENILANVEVQFESSGVNPKSTYVNFDLYHIGDNKEIAVTYENGEQISDKFISSSKENSSKTVDFDRVKIDGLTSLNGLKLILDNNVQFKLEELEPEAFVPGERPYMFVNFSISLVGYGFDASTTFHFEHVTGRRSQDFHIYAFMPLESASINNGNKQSSSVFEEEYSGQGYVVNDHGLIDIETSNNSNSLSRLVLEAGANLPLEFSTPASAEIEVKFLPVWTAVKGMADYNDNGYYIPVFQEISRMFPDMDTETALENFFNNPAYLDAVAQQFFANLFTDVNSLLFSINPQTGRLTISNNAFKGYVCVLFKGWAYDQQNGRKQVTLARFFALETLFSVRTLTPNVKETTLYTQETLSIADMSRASVDVMVALRNDQNIPTYTGKLSYFEFVSNKLASLGQDFFNGFEANGT